MKTNDILDSLQRVLEGGLVTSDNKFDKIYLLMLLDLGRAEWLVESYAKDKRLSPVCYQKYYPTLSLPLQTTPAFKKFRMPDIVRLDEHSNGIRYIGEDDYANDCTNNFVGIQSRAVLSNYNKHPVMNTNRFFSYLYDGDAQILELRGKARLVEKPLFECLFKHPTEIPTFNRDLDDYPLPLDGIYSVERMITTNDTRLMEATVPKPAFAQSETPFPKK